MIVCTDLEIATDDGRVILDKASTEITDGRLRAFVGESGSGKTTLGLALMGRVRRGLRVAGGTVAVNGATPLAMTGRELRDYRREQISWLGQDPSLSLTPWLSVREILSEALLRPRVPDDELIGLLARVSLGEAGILDRRPGQLSGGQRRRVGFARAIAKMPQVLILDEPTSGLDQAAIDDLLATVTEIRAEIDPTIVLITHDLSVAQSCADEITVMADGSIVETVFAGSLGREPMGPQLRDLWRAARLDSSDHSSWRPGRSAALSLRGLSVPLPDGNPVTTPVSLSVPQGAGLAILGPSGVGKSTFARTLIGLNPPLAGEIQIAGEPLPARLAERDPRQCRSIQLIPQDPGRSLNPALAVRTQLRQAVRRARPEATRSEMDRRIAELLELVHLEARVLGQWPRSLSGGQAQRVAIARALAHEPQVLICDESTAALDATVQHEVLDTLNELRETERLTLIMITHQQSVAEFTCGARLRLLGDGKHTIETSYPEDDLDGAGRQAVLASGRV